MFPIANKNEDNYVFSPSPLYPKDDWRNKNRHPWTEEEIRKLNHKYGVTDKINPTDTQILIYHHEIKNNSDFYIPDKKIKYNLSVGIILKIGDKCFDKMEFETGAPATYEDYVAFDFFGATIIKNVSKKLLFIDDTDIKLLVDEDVFK